MDVKGRAVRVQKRDGQRIKGELKELGLLDSGRAIQSDEEYVYIPVLGGVCNYEIVDRELPIVKKKQGFSELLAERFGEEMAKGVLSSYDVVGDIAIVQVPKELGEHEGEVGKLLLQGDRKVKVVMNKKGGRTGEFRITPLSHLAGEKRSETTYAENGVRMKLDVAKVYFSPRLGTERKRLVEETNSGEKVLVLFAGVGPFALEIGKAHPSCKVVGVELNPDAVDYFEENIRFNKLDNVEVELGDAKKAVAEKFAGWADRVIMPLPMGAEKFLDAAFLAAKPGCIVHFYKMVERERGLENAKKEIDQAGKKAGRKVEFHFEKEVRPYSVSSMQIVIDFRVL